MWFNGLSFMFKLLLESIWYYRRISLVVIAAVAISTAVIGGSLIVGDSVRFSLKRMTQQRLGQVTHVLHSGLFFREDLSGEIQSRLQESVDLTEFDLLDSPVVAPAMLLTGSMERQASEDELQRAGSVSVVGLNATGWKLLETGGVEAAADREVILGYRTAQELGADVGDEVSLWIEIPSSIPRDSLLGERSEVTAELVLTVKTVLPQDVGASRFDLNPGQQLPFNAFVDLQTIQERMGLQKVEVSRRNPIAKLARVNALLAGVASKEEMDSPVPNAARTARIQQQADDARQVMEAVQQLAADQFQLADYGVSVRHDPARDYVSIETDRMILSDSTAGAAAQAADQLSLDSAGTIVYLLNEIFASDRVNEEERFSMYSIVAGVPMDVGKPLGPFRPQDADESWNAADDEILLTAWLAEDLQVAVGDEVTAKWHAVGSDGELPEIVKSFRVAGILPDENIDTGLTPFVEGVTDVDDFGDIRQPFEMDMDRLTDRDDDYWDLYKAAPKAFLSLEAASRLWESRYGRYTSVRVALPEDAGDSQTDDLVNEIQSALIQTLQPKKLGLAFRPVREQGLQAAVGANNFTQLFLGFSFFLILSAIILASLMFRLGVQQRIRQMGLLSAVGWTEKSVRRTFLSEGLLLAIVGAGLGCILAVLFARSMVYLLTTVWIGAVGTKDLVVDIRSSALIIAFLVSVLLAVFVIGRSLRAFCRIGLRDQLAGNSDGADQSQISGSHPSAVSWMRRVFSWGGPGSVVLAIAMPLLSMAGLLPGGEAFGGLSWQMVGFFVGGFACLNAGLYVLKLILNRSVMGEASGGRGLSGLSSLAFANAARNPTRSLLTCSLIAFATFVIVAVAAGRRNPLSEVPDKSSGNGGFRYVAESASPIFFDLNSDSGRQRLAFSDEQNAVVESVDVYSFSRKPGSDASCTNLYQTRIPTMLGVEQRLIERGGFRFADTPGENPWQLLNDELEPTLLADSDITVPTIPVMGDMNTLMYSLKKGMGSHILFPDADNPEFALQVIGLLDGSVFQGVLLLSDQNLKRVDPDVAGAEYFLIEAAADSKVASVLESRLNDFGIDVESVNDRISSFLAVQNTYLSTFQMLGALGLLVGTFGLAVVMVRNVIERQREISLMKAVGFSSRRISRLIVSENLLLLFWGIFLGTLAALLAMLPHLKSTGGDLQWGMLLLTLGIVAVAGSAASLFAVRAAAQLQIRNNLAAE